MVRDHRLVGTADKKKAPRLYNIRPRKRTAICEPCEILPTYSLRDIKYAIVGFRFIYQAIGVARLKPRKCSSPPDFDRVV